MKRTFLLFMILIGLTSFAQEYKKFGVDVSNAEAPVGLNVGDLAPDFKVKNQKNEEISLNELLDKGNVVITFYRGNWCPFCNAYLANLRDSLSYILDRNTQLIAISPESHENIVATSDKHEPGFHLVGDDDNLIMKEYKVLFNVTKRYQTRIKVGLFTDIATHNNQEKAQLPIPATFVIDKDKKIIYKHFDIDFRERAPIHEIINVL